MSDKVKKLANTFILIIQNISNDVKRTSLKKEPEPSTTMVLNQIYPL